jgi:hypothetical protein
MKLTNFVNPSADIEHDFSNKKVQKWKLSKNTLKYLINKYSY